MIKAKRDELLAPLAAVSGIIERRHTLPILSNVLIDGAADTLAFLATDIEIQITARSSLASSRETRALTVGARKLLDILRALPEDAEVSLQAQDKRLLVRAGRSRFSLQTLPAEDFPRLAAWALDGRLDLAGMVSREIGLEDVPEAFEEMKRGDVIRSVVRL